MRSTAVLGQNADSWAPTQECAFKHTFLRWRSGPCSTIPQLSASSGSQAAGSSPTSRSWEAGGKVRDLGQGRRRCCRDIRASRLCGDSGSLGLYLGRP